MPPKKAIPGPYPGLHRTIGHGIYGQTASLFRKKHKKNMTYLYFY